VEQLQQPGIKRTDLQRHDLGVPRREVVQVRTWTQKPRRLHESLLRPPGGTACTSEPANPILVGGASIK
jgi:hypothetical protein